MPHQSRVVCTINGDEYRVPWDCPGDLLYRVAALDSYERLRFIGGVVVENRADSFYDVQAQALEIVDEIPAPDSARPRTA